MFNVEFNGVYCFAPHTAAFNERSQGAGWVHQRDAGNAHAGASDVSACAGLDYPIAARFAAQRAFPFGWTLHLAVVDAQCPLHGRCGAVTDGFTSVNGLLTNPGRGFGGKSPSRKTRIDLDQGPFDLAVAL